MRPLRLAPALASLALIVFAPLAGAQFKWVDADGRVGYGDKPPAGAHDIESLQGVAKGAPRDPLASLPYQLQRTIRDFPVTLYTMSDCSACDTARALLKERAVPFAEKTVATSEDVQALKRLTGSDLLPAVQVGAQAITGFNRASWDEKLDLAGYPRTSQLPADWVWPSPAPLTQARPAPAAAAAPGAAPNPGAPQP
jgi:glutaredoxin